MFNMSLWTLVKLMVLPIILVINLFLLIFGGSDESNEEV
jgi:hypothetical protein